jgi:hypothetical protein
VKKKSRERIKNSDLSSAKEPDRMFQRATKKEFEGGVPYY